MASYKNLARSGNEYARVLPGTEGGFRGVDFSSAPNRVATYRLADCQNMYRDYKSADGGALETVPGFRRIRSFKGKIHGTHHWRDAVGVEHLVIHAGDALWIADEANRDDSEAWVEVDGKVADAPSKAFCYNGFFYVLDGAAYQRLVLDEEGKASLVPVTDVAYVPTPILNGEEYEQRNAVCDKACMVGLHGGDVYQASTEDYGSHGTEKFYAKSEPFVVAGYNAPLFYCNTEAEFVVFRGEREHSNDCTVEDHRIKGVAILADGEGEVTTITSAECYKNLSAIYVSATNGGKIRLPSGKMVAGKDCKLFFNTSLAAFNDVCYTGDAFGDSVDSAMAYLPPNVAIHTGDTVVLDQDINVKSAKHTYAKSELVQIGGATSDSKVVICSENGKLAVSVGAGVTAGRHFFYGKVYDTDYVVHPLMLRIEVVERTDALPNAVEDVFEYSAAPKKLTLSSAAVSLTSVSDGERELTHVCHRNAQGLIEAVSLMAPEGRTVTVEAKLAPYHFSTAAGAELTSKEAINGCRLCTVFDNRVFLAGNPALPNAVFYSMVDDPTYFGVLNYFNEGGGFECVTALLPFSDTLAVCKEDKLYYRCAADGTDNLLPRVYVGKQGSLGLGCLGACCNFLDDPVFLTKEGVWGLNKADVTLERALGRRSGNVDPRLLTEVNLRSAEMVEWEGWLCLFVNGNVYMADSRAVFSDSAGNAQYEWFYLTGVGVWKDEDVRTPYYAAVTGDAEVNGTILNDGTHAVNGWPIGRTESEGQYSAKDVYSGIVNGISVEYVERGDKAFLVFPTSEYEKFGTFRPVKHPLVVEDRLYFGNDDGDLYVVNTDRRGKAVDGEDVESDELHRSCYSFDGHRIDAGFVTGQDDCGVPHLTKSTSHRSLTVRAKLMDNGGFAMSVYTERKPSYREIVTASPHNFYAADFGSTSYHQARSAVIVGREQEKRWVEKQYLFRDGGFCRPFGIYSVAYRYRIAGRIRER